MVINRGGYRALAYRLLFMLLAHSALGEESPGAGKLVFSNGDAAAHVASDVTMRVQGMHAEVVVEQEFHNTSQRWLNATYVYPLAEDSVVYRLTMQIGQRVIEGEIKEKEEARKIYQQAKAAGKKATLLEQQRPNLFRQQIANIGPGESIKIAIRYNQQVLYDSGEFRLRLPMTLTPRYIPGVTRKELVPEARLSSGSAGWALATDQVWDAATITPPQKHATAGQLLNPVTLDLQLNAGMELASVTSSTHKLDISVPEQGAAGERSIRFAQGQVSMDRDFELTWLPVASSAPIAAQFMDQWRGDRYAQIMLMPPREITPTQALPRELLLVLDTSGSMAGQSIEQARASAQLALEQLGPQDRFNVIFFDSHTRSVFPTAVSALPENIAKAASAVSAMRAQGGTEMHDALSRAFAHEAGEQHLQQIVFVTDGSVGNEAALLKLIHRRLAGARLFTVAIGSAPNRYFMRRAAEFGRGTFTEIANAGQVQERMRSLLSKLRKPVVANIEIDWPQPVEVFPRKVPDLYWGEPLLMTVKLAPWPSRSDQRIVIRGESSGAAWVRELVLPEPAQSPGDVDVPILARRFGREQVAFLEDEAIRLDARDQARAKILPVALEYQLMSRFTSLVAVDKTPTKPDSIPSAEHALVNAMPAGSTMQAVGYPQTATNLYWHFLLGCLAALGLWLLNRKEVTCA
ncbi:marine proteobacterial sortase target protein [Gilvimarinus sp. SDUM040013]|uniref:Marine proteobacterial sortase target protein n=1 Tax=Gilvimarinus gilvus TaxID=3058038 RepID=A0ABU4RX94_9GAMM|nr:marine proteobacterial sortase target protein [Gilvimarinus sp. SDUM040013]MDO3386797.1 marine proteobacterial sortase target protein [Gilvimarinus sp. SDUM040013]MDX6848273.1 marine proteobacterial sortase target protein [Gilvimarinus sp. SDUM040013]